MEMDSFQYWLQEASIEELEVFGRFTPQSKKTQKKYHPTSTRLFKLRGIMLAAMLSIVGKKPW